jgi:hypothetical protein
MLRRHNQPAGDTAAVSFDVHPVDFMSRQFALAASRKAGFSPPPWTAILVPLT